MPPQTPVIPEFLKIGVGNQTPSIPRSVQGRFKPIAPDLFSRSRNYARRRRHEHKEPPSTSPGKLTGIALGGGLTLVRVADLYAHHSLLGMTYQSFLKYLRTALGLTFWYPASEPYVVLQDFILLTRVALLPGKPHLAAPGSEFLTNKKNFRRQMSRSEYKADLEEALTLMLHGARQHGVRLTTHVPALAREVASRMMESQIISSDLTEILPKLQPNIETGPYTFDEAPPTGGSSDAPKNS